MAERTPEQKHTLSLALIGVAGSLLVGNFASFSTFVTLTADRGDTGVILALIVTTALLIGSIVAGGQRRYDMQAWLGALGVAVSLVAPGLAIAARESPADPLLRRLEVLEARMDNLHGAEADLARRLSRVEAAAPLPPRGD